MQFTYVAPPPALFVDWNYFGFIELGTWDYPFHTVYTAHVLASDGYDVFVRPAYYPEAPITLNKRITLHSWDGPVTIGKP
jgi:hypothetical protein